MSSSVAKPIIKQIKDRQDALDFFEHVSLPKEDEKTQEIIMNFPTVYIHNWQESGDFEVYVGESNDIFKRTRQHYDAASDNSKWQSKLLEKDASLFIIGHEHFNKSLTLDIENRLMHYMMSVDRVKHVHNLRDNPQTSYYPMEELDEIFSRIWRGLRKENKELFPTESVIKDSAIYKASPLHKLTKKQEKARELIIQKVSDALENGEKKQLIFIDGEAGTGKTVLNSSTFYELYCQAEENNKEIKCHLLVNHDEQITVYEQIAEKLGLTEKYGKVVSKPTTFINNHSEGDPVDVAFVDEAHLLLTQGKQSYQGENQLKDIIDRARVTVVMFDENQILTTEQFWESQILEKYRNQAKATNNYIVLDKQLRMQADAATMDWIDSFTKKGQLKKLPNTFGGYITPIKYDPMNVFYLISKLLFTESGRKIYLRKKIANEIIEILTEEYKIHLSDKIDNYKVLKIINSISESDENGVVYLQKAINSFLIELGIDLNLESRLQKAYEDFILMVKDRVKNNHLSTDVDTFKQCFKEKEGVVINTFHGVKGEEYTTVIAFGILNGYIPHWNTIIKKSHDYRESETKKLLYVVCSRAKKKLYLFSEQGRTTKKGALLTSTDEIVAIDYKYDNLI